MEYGWDSKNPENKWHNGNIDIYAQNPQPFGFLIYAKPLIKRKYKYRSGKTKTEYERMCYGGEFADEALRNGYYLRWLDAVPCINKPDEVKTSEMDYNENTAMFFVNMIKSVCMMNERMKDFLNPEAMELMANRGGNILTMNTETTKPTIIS